MHDHLANATELTGPGWAGDSVERQWAAAANDAVKTKSGKLNQPGYTQYGKNWLAAYASAPGPALDLVHGSQFLNAPSSAGFPLTFDLVLLLTDSKLVLLDNSGSRVVQLERI